MIDDLIMLMEIKLNDLKRDLDGATGFISTSQLELFYDQVERLSLDFFDMTIEQEEKLKKLKSEYLNALRLHM